MKLSAVYKSLKKTDCYLYVEKRDDFSRVPDALLKQFGTPQFFMLVALTKHDTIANISTSSFIAKMQAQGFYLQMPPKEKSLLSEHRESIGLNEANRS